MLSQAIRRFSVNWDAVGAIGEIVGAIAVLATLAYVSIQVKLHSRQLEVANEQEAFRQLSEWIRRISIDPSAKSVFEKVSHDQPLSEQDEIDWAWIIVELANMGEAHSLQYRKGALSQEVWLKYEGALTAYLSTRIGRIWWVNRMAPFSAEFTAYFDRILEQPSENSNYVSSIHQKK